MAVDASNHWMDRVRASTPQTGGLRNARLINPKETSTLIMARSALRARVGLTQEELYRLARRRQQVVLQAKRPKQLLLSLGLIAAGTIISILGSMTVSQTLLLSGFGIGFLGALQGCTILAGYLAPQMGDLAVHFRPEEQPATPVEIGDLFRAAQCDAELAELISTWWTDAGAPVRKQDLALVRNFQNAKR